MLRHATEALLASPPTEESVAGCIELAKAWQDLAEAWEDRQANQAALVEAETEFGEATVETDQHAK